MLRSIYGVCLVHLCVAGPLAVGIGLAHADSGSRDEAISEIRQQIEALRADQDARIEAIRSETNARIRRLEQALDRLDPPPAEPVSLAGAEPIEAPAAPATEVSGDFRLRFEGNYGDRDAPDRERGVLRARLGVRHALTPKLSVGARLATGDSDDPNSTDVTLSSFDDDLDVSLDQAYIRYDSARWTGVGGKFALPMVRTEMLWDADVNPEGAAATFKWPAATPGSALRVHTLYAVIDEQARANDSGMLGLQVAGTMRLSSAWDLETAAAYYDYDLHALGNADAGDVRGNRLDAEGTRYLSDFDLLDVIAAVQYRGWGPRWPVRLSGDYVRNLGAVDGEDTGYSIALSAGQVQTPLSWRLAYDFSIVERDAVFAAFSNDNTLLSTNYRQHTLSLDYAPMAHAVIGATLYVYRPYRSGGSTEGLSDDWHDRLRLNFLVTF